MTVCIASDGFPPKAGGIVSFNWHLTQLLLNAGHAVIQININRTPGAKDDVIEKGNFTQVWLAESFSKYKKQWSAYLHKKEIRVRRKIFIENCNYFVRKNKVPCKLSPYSVDDNF